MRERMACPNTGAAPSAVAPAAESSSAFQAAASLPPATTTRLPSSAKNNGRVESRPMRGGRAGCGIRGGGASDRLMGGLGSGLFRGDQTMNLRDAAAAIGAGAEARPDPLERAAALGDCGRDARGADLEADAHDGPLVDGPLDRPAGQQ